MHGSPRTRISLNDGWKFIAKEFPGGEKTPLDDRNWQRISIPHTWNDKDPFDDEPGYRRGYLISMAAEVRQRAGVAVLVGGGITSRDEADTALAAGRADLIRIDPYLYRRPLMR